MTPAELQLMIDAAEAYKSRRRESFCLLLGRDVRDLTARERAQRRQIERHGEPWPTDEPAERPDDSREEG